MELRDLTKRAIEVRRKFVEYEKKKWGREWGNEQIMEGFVSDVGDLMKIVMAKEGLREIENVDEKLKHELMDCLWSILVLCERYGIDVEKSFLEEMDVIEKRLEDQNY